jgi:hypothetical protein
MLIYNIIMSGKKYYGIAIYLQNREDYRKLMIQEQDVILNIMNRCGIEHKIEAVYGYNPKAVGWPDESGKAIGTGNIDRPKIKDSMIILLDTEDSPELREKIKCFREGLREHGIRKTDFIGITFYYEFNNLTREKITIEPNKKMIVDSSTSSSMPGPPLPGVTGVPLPPPPPPAAAAIQAQPSGPSEPNAGGTRKKHKTKKSKTKKTKKTKKSRKQNHRKYRL